MFTALRSFGLRLETTLAGALSPEVRRNMHLEVAVALAYGAFYASVLSFTPVVLRRLGATPEMLAIFSSASFLGSILTSLSVVLMRRRRTMNVILTCWFAARSLFLLCAVLTQAWWLIILSSLFWLLEGFVIPAYTRVVQKIYPDAVRGKVMSTVRMGQVAAILLVTPLAGWALDHWSFQVLFPLGSVMGILSAYLFTYVEVNEGPLPPRETKTFGDLWQIVQGDERFRRYLVGFAMLGLGTMMSAPLYPLVQVDRLHLSYSAVGWLGFIESTLWLLSYLFWGRWLDRHGGVWVMRTVCLISMFIPGTYIFASSGWLLIPAFIARGIVMAGFELGRINSGIQLADANRIIEYAAIQSTTVGIRGIIAPLLGVTLLRLGVPDWGVFTLSVALMATGWLLLGRVQAPKSVVSNEVEQERLEARWPFRFRRPRL